MDFICFKKNIICKSVSIHNFKNESVLTKTLKRSSIFLFALTVLSVFPPLSAKTSLLKSENNGELVEVKFKIDKYNYTNIPVNGESCVFIDCEDAAYTEEKGSPTLPFFTESIIIPDNAQMSFEIVDSTVIEMSIDKIIPSKGSMKRNINPADLPFIFGDTYEKNEWYPKQNIVLGEPYILNSLRGMVVKCYPFQYNPATNLLRIMTSVTVRIRQTGISSVNTIDSENKEISPSIHNLYSRHFINYPKTATRYSKVSDGDKMIVISTSALSSSVDPLVKWKNQKGISTKLYIYPDQTGGTGATALKKFISSKFNDEKISYILLVGDNSDIPSISSNGGLSDPSYIKIKGNDSYPDAFIGRFSSSSASGIKAIVDKTLIYEKNPDPSADWYQKGVGIASDEAQGGMTDKAIMESHRTKLLTYGYTVVDKIYDPNASKTNLKSALDNGRGWVNYMGHGTESNWVTTGFNNSDISSLKNANMPSIILSVACENGKFEKNCFAETFTTSSNKGALVFIGSSILQDWTPPQYTMKEVVEQLLTKDQCLSVGAIFYNGQCNMLDKGNGDETFNTWNFFGDPSVMPFTKKPSALTITCPEVIDKGNQEVTVSFNKAITGRVCLYSPAKGILGTKLLSTSSSQVKIPVTIEEQIDSLILTVTAFNHVTIIKKIEVQTVPLRVVSPGSGSILWSGAEVPIEWKTSNNVNINNVKIEYSTNGGQSYTQIVQSTSNTSSYKWIVPDQSESDQCQIRVSEVGGSHTAVSEKFSIKFGPKIVISKSSIKQTILPGNNAKIDFKISNAGKGALNYSVKSKCYDSKVLINELYVSKDEFYDGLELLNYGNDVNLSGWKLIWSDDRYPSESYTFTSDFILKHNKTVILMDIQKEANDSNMVYVGTNIPWDRNVTKLSVALIDNNDQGVDFVRCSGNSDNPPKGTTWSGDGITMGGDFVYRISDKDTDSKIDWGFASSGTFNQTNPGQSTKNFTLFISKPDGTIAALKDTSIFIQFMDNYKDSTYFDTLIITHNDPNRESPIIIPCQIIVDSKILYLSDNSSTRNSTLSIKHYQRRNAVNFVFTGSSNLKKELRIFNLLGHLIYHESGLEIEPWRYTNVQGHRIADGRYFALVNVYNQNNILYTEKFSIAVNYN